MPTLPWTPGPARRRTDTAVVMASRFELTTARQVLPFFLAALRVHHQIRHAEGAVGLTLIAHPLRRRFYTLSAWSGQPAIDAMARAEPHRSVMTHFRQFTSEATFTFWEIPAGTRPTWKEAHRRLDSASQGS